MWDEQKRERFRQLHQRQDAGILTEAEATELTCLVADLEAAEATYLAPATQRLRRERETVETQNSALETLAHRKEALVRRLHVFLAEAQAERRQIDDELAAVLTGSQSPESDR
jgi:hypothetical protein